MGSDPIFESSMLGFTVKVFKNRIEYKKLFQKVTIPVNQIASIDAGIPGVQAITVETTGGKKHKIVIVFTRKNELVEAINQAQYGD